MRVLMLSKACLVGIYQRKLELIAAHPAIDSFKTVVPPYWRDERGVMPLERVHLEGYDLHVTPMNLNGNFHFHYYPEFGKIVRDFQPDIVHIDEEPYNLATWLALRAALSVQAKTLFFSWQNINRRYPLPVSRLERWVLNTVDYAMMGTESAAQVWQAKGYQKPYAVIPQFGVDPEHFEPRTTPAKTDAPIVIGYFGRLIKDKGIDVLLAALGKLKQFAWHLLLVGGGPEEHHLKTQAQALGILDRIQFVGQVPSTEMPTYFHKLDMFVIPSRTLKNWKEQFGRVIIEAMASGVPVIGSNSGAIPDVIGEAGLIFQEDDVDDLVEKLTCLLENPAKRQHYAEQGVARVKANFTQQQIAEKTVLAYQEMLRLKST